MLPAALGQAPPLPAALVGVDDDLSLQAPTVWGGYGVDVRFRLHRWSSHIREHTIQLEKTLALLSRDLQEVERLVRLLLAGYGGLEAAAIGVALEGEAGHVLSGCADYVSGCVAQMLAASS